MTIRFDDVYASTAKAHSNSNFALALVPAPEQARVALRAEYLSNTGHRPSAALTLAVNEWRTGSWAFYHTW